MNERMKVLVGANVESKISMEDYAIALIESLRHHTLRASGSPQVIDEQAACSATRIISVRPRLIRKETYGKATE